MEEAIGVFCKAQSKMKSIEREKEEVIRNLNERIKTCRNIIHDEMRKKGISCAEVFAGDDEPVYLRCKPQVQSGPVRGSDVIRFLEDISNRNLEILAEKCEYDLPRMITEFINLAIKEERRSNSADKDAPTTLTISKAKERNFTGLEDRLSEDTKSTAREFLLARKELSELRKIQNQKKKDCKEDQKRVEDDVKKVLKLKDPDNMTQKIHITQEDGDWMYFLQCKEKHENKTVGLRKALPIIESCVSKSLEENGLPKQYISSTLYSTSFLESLRKTLIEEFQKIENEVVSKTKITLNRGAPRKKKQN